MIDVNTLENHIAIPGGKIYVKRWMPELLESDRPLVLLHDSLGSVAQWRDFPTILANALKRQVIAYDRLGFGRSSARRGLPTAEFIFEEATNYFPYLKSSLGIKHYGLLGHSVGGGIAVNIAAQDPDCDFLITISAQAFVEEVTLQGIREAKILFHQPEQIARLEKWHGDKARWVLDAWTERWLSPDFKGWSLENCIHQVQCPLLAIHGDQDEYGSIAFPEFLSSQTAGQGFSVILENCGHIPHREKPQEVIHAIVRFLKRFHGH